ncbi:hypothetical protein KOW79_007986 [Hemibagrus wyckioides]|uniref:SH3 domain-containing protein n=1 Tax=Hemibagrus wyckioides TaxID=337641 RepID=A0A9D3SL39_9TELE|nr:hypothetical protein KOW79_007986 [Hemibagrus wyckioides]
MWNFSTMASLHLPILLQFILSLVQSSRLMSDYKTCGDDACARLMSRVQALRDHGAQDCRFLSFKKGDMIDVYHKLSGRRSELWAGSRDKDFGYFPKDAVKIDEVFVDEKKEIEMRAQKTDFFCMDAFGTIIVSGEEFEDYEFGAQTGESEELGNADFDHRVSKSSETNENVETRHVDNDNKDRGKAEPSRSSWIGSAVSGWFANDADEAGNENKELENFKSRKLALDMEQLNGDGDGQEDKTDSDEDSSSEQVSYLLEDGIKSLLGFGGGEILPSETKKQDENMQNLRKEQEAITENENIVEKKDAGWYDSFYNRITKFYGDPADKSEASNDEEESLSHGGTDVDKVKEEKNPDPGSESLLIQDSEGDRNAANHKKRQEVSRQDETGDSQLGEGWYGSVYNRITGLYGDTGDGSTAPDKSDVIENGRGDPPGTSDSMDVGSSPDEKPGTSDPIAERMTENNNAGWYNSIYSRITNVYGDTSDQNDVPEVMKESESQTQSESTEDTSSQSIFTRNDLSTVIDSLRGEGSQDETKVSESVRSETSDDDDDDDDDDGDEGSGLRDKENTENLTDSEQNQDISQSVFSGMINGLKSPFKPNNAGDKEESDEEKTLDTGKEEQSDNDDEISVRSTEVASEISTQRTAVVSEQEEEEAEHEVQGAEAQIHAVEPSLDCNKQDSSGEGRKRDEFSDQSTRSTNQSTNITSELNTDESETLEEPGWAEHLSDTSKSRKGDANTNTVSGELPEKEQVFTGEEETQSERETRADSGLQVRTDVTKNTSETVDESAEAQDEGGAADMLREAEEAGMKVRSNEAEQILHTESNAEKHGVDVPHRKSSDATQIENSEENQSGNITLMKEDEEREDTDITEMENHGIKDDGVVTPLESGGENEDVGATRTDTDGEKESLNITLTESGGEMEGEVTHVEYSGGQDHEEVAQMESAGENESIVITQMESGGDNTSGELTPVKNAGEQDDVDDSQNVTDGQKESVHITQMEYEGEKGDDITQVVSDGEKEDVNLTQKESDGEKEGVDIIQKEHLSLHNGLENSHSISETNQNLEIDPDESRECEKRENCAEVMPKNIQDTPSTGASETDTSISRTSDGDQNHHDSKTHGDKMMDVKHHKAQTSSQTQKPAHPNLRAHLSEEDMQVLLQFFSGETLSWLDFIIGHSEFIDNEELAELHDFEQTLEHLLKTRNQEIKPSLPATQAVLAMLRKKFRPVIADGSVDKSPDPSQTECVTETCLSTTENTPMSEQETGKDTDTGSSTDDSENVIGKARSNDQEVVTEKTRLSDTLESDQKSAPQLDTNIITEEFLKPEESHKVLRPYTALAAELTSDVVRYMVKESVRVTHAVHQVGPPSAPLRLVSRLEFFFLLYT